ncbi:MAG TPA: c-type cytochrome [Magnetospirillaceae bacterium]|nr:c-type cytochrome [Magnetospirillaceae bacterium]
MIRYAVCALLLTPVAAFAADAGHGKQVFEQCAACHGAQGQGGDTAPQLVGVIGRKAGSLEEFRYSPAMKRSAIVWDQATLKGFVMNPQGVVKGTRMPFDGLRDEKDAEDVAAYVATLR